MVINPIEKFSKHFILNKKNFSADQSLIENFDNSLSMTDVDLVPKSCKVEIIPFCEKSHMDVFLS